jgi:hypothetical protein
VIQVEPVAAAVPRLRHIVFLAAVVVAVLQVYGGAVGTAAATVALLLAGWLGWKADLRYLAAVLVLSYPSFGLAGPQLEELLGFPDAVRAANIGGVAVAAPLVVMLSAAFRTVHEMLRPRFSTYGWSPRWPALLLVVAMAFAAIGALHGRSMGLNRWSEGFRSVLAVGGFFWGFMLTRTAGFSVAHAHRLILRVTAAGCALFVVGLLDGHFIFLLVGLAPAILPQLLRARKLVAAGFAAWVSLYGLVFGTLTMAATVLLAVGTLLLTAIPVPVVRRMLVSTAVAATLALSIGLLWAVAAYGEELAIELTLAGVAGEGGLQYALFKLMGDRGPLWLAAIQQIVNGPYLIAPSGRALLPSLGYFEGSVWEFGAHNSVLQVLRNAGMVSAGALFSLMVYFLVRTAAVVASGSRLSRPLAAACIAIALSGITTSDFPVSDVGFFLWTMGGIAVGVHALYPEIRKGQTYGRP